MGCYGQFGGGEAFGADVQAGAAGLGGLASWPADDSPVGEGPAAIEVQDVRRFDVAVQPVVLVRGGQSVDQGA